MGLVHVLAVLGCVSSLVPALALFLRRPPAVTRLAAWLLSMSMFAYVLIIRRICGLGPRSDGVPWVYGLVVAGIVATLASYLLSAIIGREKDDRPQYLRPSFIGLAAIGVLFLVYLKHDQFVVGFDWVRGGGIIKFSYLGKAYLSYLLVGIVLVASNLESTYRVASRPIKRGLLVYFIMLFALLGFATYVFASGLLYSFLPLNKLVALIIPLSAGAFAVGHGFLRGKLLDSRVPVSRAVVYSSISAVAAGLYLLSIGLVAQAAGAFHWSPNAIISISLVFFGVLLSVLLSASRRIQRSVRRFVDRNFYVKKHDYQGRWGQVTEALDPGQGEETLLHSVAELYQDTFYARSITISLRDKASGVIRPVMGKGTSEHNLVLVVSDPLCRKFMETRRSILLDRNRKDFEYLPIYVEEQAWLSATASEALSPLMVANELVGVVGLDRKGEHETFTFEDLELMDRISFQVATVLKGLHLTRELTEAREIELLGQWSSMILHDLKNQLLPLQALARNIAEYMDNPEFLREAVNDLTALSRGTENLIQRVSRLREEGQPSRERVDLNRVVRKLLDDIPAARSPNLRLAVELEEGCTVSGDAGQLESVVRNLIVNALDAMRGSGSLEIKTRRRSSQLNGPEVVFTVADTGPGMEPEFVRSRLFTPFATTKKTGLGLGLYQCRNVVRAHGGEILVESVPGSGTRFEVVLMSVDSVKAVGTTLEVVR